MRGTCAAHQRRHNSNPRRYIMTKLANNVSILLARLAGASLAACAGDAPATGGDDDDGGDEPVVDDDDDVPAGPTDLNGAYTMRSKFDLAASVPGTAGEVVSVIIDA